MKTSTGALSLRASAMPAAAADRAAARGLDERAIAYWLLCCCGMIVVMVVLGGITRLTQSGLSITDWQPVIGVVPPLSHADWVAEFGRYKLIPQYHELNAGMSLADFKYIFMWEYVHRLWGRLIGIAYLVPFVWFIARRRVPRRLVLPLAGIFALGGAQGLLGWYMVESGLVHRVEVSQYRLVAHLALALAIYAATLWIALGILWPPVEKRLAPAWRRLSEALLALVALTICAGGFTAGLRAGLVDNTFPLMDGHFVPAGYAQLHPFVHNWFENIAAVQFDHRLLAETTLTAIVLLWLAGWRTTLPRPMRLAQHVLLAAVLLQFALGVATLLLIVPIPLAAAHQAGAVLLLTAALVFRHSLRRPI
jgi:cytochrome c oxidase assembly protein subunit 15